MSDFLQLVTQISQRPPNRVRVRTFRVRIRVKPKFWTEPRANNNVPKLQRREYYKRWYVHFIGHVPFKYKFRPSFPLECLQNRQDLR